VGARDIISLVKARQKVACSVAQLLTLFGVVAQPRGPVERYEATLSKIGDKTGKKHRAY